MSSLAVTYSDLRAEIGHYLGYGRTPSAWTDSQAALVEDVLRSGLRRFYWPPAVNRAKPHKWSFLCVPFELTTASGVHTYSLPEDFAAFNGLLVVSTGVSPAGTTIIASSPLAFVQSQIAGFGAHGVPAHYAIRAQSHDYDVGTRYQILFYPIPSGQYVVRGKYNIVPDAIGADKQCPPGGIVHGQTILEACLAEAELRAGDKAGVHDRLFAALLEASIARDIDGTSAEAMSPLSPPPARRPWHVEYRKG